MVPAGSWIVPYRYLWFAVGFGPVPIQFRLTDTEGKSSFPVRWHFRWENCVNILLLSGRFPRDICRNLQELAGISMDLGRFRRDSEVGIVALGSNTLALITLYKIGTLPKFLSSVVATQPRMALILHIRAESLCYETVTVSS